MHVMHATSSPSGHGACRFGVMPLCAFCNDAAVAFRDFYAYSVMMAEHMSGPSIMYQARLQNGKVLPYTHYEPYIGSLRPSTPSSAYTCY